MSARYLQLQPLRSGGISGAEKSQLCRIFSWAGRRHRSPENSTPRLPRMQLWFQGFNVRGSSRTSLLMKANCAQRSRMSLSTLAAGFVRQAACEHITYISRAAALYPSSDYNKCFLAL